MPTSVRLSAGDLRDVLEIASELTTLWNRSHPGGD
jgi:hypothetical protein